MSAPREPLGSPARVRITKVVRTSYRLEWEYDGHGFWFDEETGSEYHPRRRLRVRHMQHRGDVYRAAAMRLIFARRDEYATGVYTSNGNRIGCRLCDQEHDHGEEGPALCRYHGGKGFEELRERLAGWLLWRDRAIAARQPPEAAR